MLTLETAFTATKSGEYRLRTRALGTLSIESGAVTACDPLVSSDAEPFTRKVPNGTWPVDLVLARTEGDTRVAFARMRFGEAPPVQFVLAHWEGQNPETRGNHESFGYGVDSGTGCFADPTSGWDVAELERGLEENAQSTWSWAQSGGCVAFSTGYGDGSYASYFGLDDAGHVVCVVTDFGVLDVDLPGVPKNTSARREKAKGVAAELLAAIAKKERREALDEIRGRLVGMKDAADGALPALLTAFLEAQGARREFLEGVVTELGGGAAAFDAIAPFVARFDTSLLESLLATRQDDLASLPSSLVAALVARWDVTDLASSAVILEALGRDAPLPAAFGRLADECATAVLASPDDPSAARAARALALPYGVVASRKDVAPRNLAPPALAERLMALARVAERPHGTRAVLRASRVQGLTAPLVSLLEDPELGLVAAMALCDVPEHRARVCALLVQGAKASIDDPPFCTELLSRIPDYDLKCETALELGHAGLWNATVVLREACAEPGDLALTALGLLAMEAQNGSIRSAAKYYLDEQQKRAVKKEKKASKASSKP